MNRFLKLFALLSVGLLAACSDAPYVSQPAVLQSGASIQTGVTGGGLRGTEETLVEIITPSGTSHMVRSGYGLGRELILATVPALAPVALNGAIAAGLQGRGCGGSNCGGTTFVVQGGQAVAGATATSDSGSTVNINTACINPINGVCPAAP